MQIAPKPPHLYGILAANAKKAVLIRRGPSNWWQLILWRTDTDEIERGQWVKHRINLWGCDLSPDGRLFVYSALGGRKYHDYHQWVAVSKPPCFTALALWPASGPGGGSGAFEDKRTLVLYGEAKDRPERHPKVPLTIVRNKWLVSDDLLAVARKPLHLHAASAFTSIPESLSAPELARLQREHWRLNADTHWWERSPKNGKWPLCWKRILEEGSRESPRGDRYAVRVGNRLHPLEGAEWAAIDQGGRLVFAREGKLFAGKPGAAGTEETLLADFCLDKPNPVAPPASASHWPR